MPEERAAELVKDIKHLREQADTWFQKCREARAALLDVYALLPPERVRLVRPFAKKAVAEASDFLGSADSSREEPGA